MYFDTGWKTDSYFRFSPFYSILLTRFYYLESRVYNWEIGIYKFGSVIFKIIISTYISEFDNYLRQMILENAKILNRDTFFRRLCILNNIFIREENIIEMFGGGGYVV